MIRRPTRYTQTATLWPYTTLFLSLERLVFPDFDAWHRNLCGFGGPARRRGPARGTRKPPESLRRAAYDSGSHRGRATTGRDLPGPARPPRPSPPPPPRKYPASNPAPTKPAAPGTPHRWPGPQARGPRPEE